MRRRGHIDHWRRWGAQILRRRREALGLSRARLAQQTGLAPATIRNLELGVVQRPERTTLRRLCDALSLPLPGEEGLYLSLDGVAADRLRCVTRDALCEYALRRRNPRRFIAAVAAAQTVPLVRRDRDLARRLRDTLHILDDFPSSLTANIAPLRHRPRKEGTP